MYFNPKEGGGFSRCVGQGDGVEIVLKTLCARATTFLCQINQKWSQMTADIIIGPNIPHFFSEAPQKYPRFEFKVFTT